MRTLHLSVCAAAVACATGLVLAPMPAQAASCSYTPKAVSVRDRAVNVNFDVNGSNDWSLDISGTFIFVYSSPGDDNSVSNVDPYSYENADAGSHAAVISDYDNGGNCSTTFKLQRASLLSLGVTAKSGVRTLSGKLTRVNWGLDVGTYSPVTGQSVIIQHQTASGRWVNDKGVKTKTGGVYSTKVTAGPRTWRAYYPGISTTQAKTSTSHHG